MDDLTKLVMMKFRGSPTVFAPIFLVKATSGGKSLVRDIFSMMFRGVSLTIVHLLALVVDQTSKVSTNSIKNSSDQLAVHLDEVHNALDKHYLVYSILALSVKNVNNFSTVN